VLVLGSDVIVVAVAVVAGGGVSWSSSSWWSSVVIGIDVTLVRSSTTTAAVADDGDMTPPCTGSVGEGVAGEEVGASPPRVPLIVDGTRGTFVCCVAAAEALLLALCDFENLLPMAMHKKHATNTGGEDGSVVVVVGLGVGMMELRLLVGLENQRHSPNETTKLIEAKALRGTPLQLYWAGL
jgi:hypothetical protein